jgi:hypothetical protein
VFNLGGTSSRAYGTKVQEMVKRAE